MENWRERAIFQAGIDNEKQQRFAEARKLFKSLIEKYSNDEYREKTKHKIDELADK